MPPRLAANPPRAALRVGERAENFAADPSALPTSELTRLSAPAALSPQAPSRFDASLILLAALAVGTLLLMFSVAPEPVLLRGPGGTSVVRARVEIGLVGGAIVALVSAIYLVAASS